MPERLVLVKDSITDIFIRPEVTSRQSKKERTCNTNADYSYARVSSAKANQIISGIEFPECDVFMECIYRGKF